MSSIDPSMESMLEMFIYESTTLLEELDEIMLNSEKSQTISEKNINEIFRIMHTIKGSSAMMGLESISSLAHSVEDVFFIIRENPAKLDAINDSIYDLLFQASDFIKSEIDELQSGDYQAKDSSDLIKLLEDQAAIMNGSPRESQENLNQPAQTAKPVENTVSTSENGFYQVRVFFEDGCQMENIRAFMLLSQMKDWCDELDSIPQSPESDSSLSSKIIENGFIVKFKTSGNPDDVYKIIENSINVKSYEIMGSPEESSTEPAAPAVAAATTTKKESSQAKAKSNATITTKVSKQSLISVNKTKLDQLMDLVGELVTAESMVANNPDLKGLELDNFNKSTRELRKLTDELQDVVMSMRMVPLHGVFQKMNRIIRDMGKKLSKDVELVTIGGDTEVDKTINDSITDPFMHMIRNAMDHAIESPEDRRALGKPETGKVTMEAHNIGGEIVITISDDGRGLETEKILAKAKKNGLLTKPEAEYSDKEIYHMIMLPGFSTNEAVTEFSGRGVGMDVVRKNLEKVGGAISVESAPNVGTTFTIKIPLTLAIVDGMEISVGASNFTIPITSIKQSFKIFEAKQVIYNTDGSEMIMIRGECFPIIRLHELFSIDDCKKDLTDGIVLQIENANHVACIFADELIGEQQVVVKPFPAFLNRYNIKQCGLSGCTILGDGSISLILDANNLLSIFERQ